MAHLFEIVEGTTIELPPMTLRINDAPQDLTGKTVVLKLRSAGTSIWVDTVGDLRVGTLQTTTEKGMVYFTPDATDFSAIRSPYLLRFNVTDATGKVNFFPNKDSVSIKVNPV
jgi:hypothetical protein